jgi:hypothetical protein
VKKSGYLIYIESALRVEEKVIYVWWIRKNIKFEEVKNMIRNPTEVKKKNIQEFMKMAAKYVRINQ